MFVGPSASSARFVSALVAALAMVLSGLAVTAPTASATSATSAAPAAAECTPLGDADLASGAPHLTGALPAGSEGECFTVTDPHGMQLFIGSMTEDVRVRVRSAPTNSFPDGEQLCLVDSRDTCRLPAAGPVTIEVLHWFGDATDYEVQLLRVAADAGCLTEQVAAFGDATTVARATLGGNEAACRTFDLSTGVHAVNEQNVDWALYDDVGELVCQGGDRCAVPRPGTYVLLLLGFRDVFDTEPHEKKLSVVDLSSTEGCGPDTDLAWTAAPVTVGDTTPLALHCRTVPVATGDLVVVGARSPGTHKPATGVLVDAGGEESCAPRGGAIGCQVTGEPPYRLLSRVTTAPGDLEVVVRSLEPGNGCPEVAPQAFGTAPDDVVPGSGCRRLVVESDQPTPFVVQPVVNGSVPSEGATPEWIYDENRQQPCLYFQHSLCRLSTGSYWVITDVFPVDLRTTVHDLSSAEGCATRATDLTPYHMSLATGVFDCTTLPLPEGSVVAAAHVDDSEDWDHGTVVIDGDGKVLCDEYDAHTLLQCRLTGPPPYRVVVGGASSTQEKLAFMEVGQPGPCAPFPGGGYDESTRVDVALTAERFVSCLHIPAEEAHDKELVRFQRTHGVGTMSLHAINDAGGRIAEHGERGYVYVDTNPAGSGLTVVAVQTLSGGDNTYRLSRYGATEDTSGCRQVSSTVLGGTAAPASLDDFLDADCLRVHADPSDRIWVDARDAEGAADMFVFADDGEYQCKTLATPCVLTGHTSYQLVLQTRGDAPVAADVDTWTVESDGGISPECVRYEDYDTGFGPLEATLSHERTGTCVVLEAASSQDGYELDIVNAEGGSAKPRAILVEQERKGNVYPCDAWLADGLVCSSLTSGNKVATPVVVFPLPERVERLPFSVTGTCVGPWGGPSSNCARIFKVFGAAPMAGKVGDTATVTVDGRKLSVPTPWDRPMAARLVREGHDAVAGTQKVHDDRHPVFEFDLGGTAVGEWTLEVVHPDDGTLAVPEPFVVEPGVLAPTQAPEVRGLNRVDGRVRAYEGTWSATPDSFSYQWQLNGRDIDGATSRSLLLRAGMLRDQVSVKVTARKVGYVDGAAASGVVKVYRGYQPRTTERPRVRGVKRPGNVVRATRGVWNKRPSSYSFRWYKDGRRIRGATSRRLFLRKRWRWSYIHVRVVAHRAGCYNGRATSRSFMVRG
ncbi:MAG TPA: hypothetical protein VFZ64_02955 [Nocardioidaceae bacterium]